MSTRHVPPAEGRGQTKDPGTISGAVPVSLSLSGCTGDEGAETDGARSTDDGGRPTDSPQSPDGDSSSRTTGPARNEGDGEAASVYVYRLEDDAERQLAIATLLERFEVDVAGQRVAVKANFNSGDPFLASTPRNTGGGVRRNSGGADVVLAERSEMGDTATVLEETGVLALAEEKGVETVVLDELDADRWRREDAPESHGRDGFLVLPVDEAAGTVAADLTERLRS